MIGLTTSTMTSTAPACSDEVVSISSESFVADGTHISDKPQATCHRGVVNANNTVATDARSAASSATASSSSSLLRPTSILSWSIDMNIEQCRNEVLRLHQEFNDAVCRDRRKRKAIEEDYIKAKALADERADVIR